MRAQDGSPSSHYTNQPNLLLRDKGNGWFEMTKANFKFFLNTLFFSSNTISNLVENSNFRLTPS